MSPASGKLFSLQLFNYHFELVQALLAMVEQFCRTLDIPSCEHAVENLAGGVSDGAGTIQLVVLVHAFNTNHIRAEPLLTLITISQKTPYKTQVAHYQCQKSSPNKCQIQHIHTHLDDLEISLRAFG